MTNDRLDQVESEFRAATLYNKYLMEIFLKYIRNCQLRSGYATQAESLKHVLEANAIGRITSWQNIYDLSEKHQLWDVKYRNTGCAFKKIGRMLQELGVIGHSEAEGSNQKKEKKLFDQLSGQNKKWVKSFLIMMEQKNRALRTRIVYLQTINKLEKWLVSRDGQALKFLTPNTARSYLDDLKGNGTTQNQLYSSYCYLNKFYRWGIREEYVSKNPFEVLRIRPPISKLRHCSDADIKKLIAYIKNYNSDPEYAMILTLILFFGLTREEITLAQLSANQHGGFSVILARKKLTVGRNSYSREQIQEMPTESAWLRNLQERYLKIWNSRYEKVHKLLGRRPVFLPRNHGYAVALNSRVIERRIKEATQEALGGPSLSYTLLKNTCAAIHVQGDDASILTKLGWSSSYAFKYVYREREIHTST